MRCEEVQENLVEASAEAISVPIREHLARCAACAAYAQDWRLVRAGFRALAEEPVPKASLGFAVRLVHRLEDAADRVRVGTDFLELVGRRVVYASLLLALTLLLSLVLPASGPLRGPTTAELDLAQPEVVTAGIDPIFAYEFPGPLDLAPANSTRGNEKGQK